MHIRIATSVVTSRGVVHRGVMLELPEAEAWALIRMGRAVPCESEPVVAENRDSMPVVKRGRARKSHEPD